MEVILGPNTSLADIASWPLEAVDDVQFHFTHDSSFGLLSEAAGVAAYQAIRKNSRRVVVKIKYTTVEIMNLESYIKRSRVLYSIFGLNLIRTCDKLIDSSGRDIKDVVNKIIREELQHDRDGTIMRGEKTWVVSQWPAPPIPKCLAITGEQRPPEPQDVSALLHQLRFRYEKDSRTAGGTWNLNQRPVVSFVYETFRNIIEHARIEDSGCCGILVERITIARAEDVARYVIDPSPLASYLKSFVGSDSGTRSVDFTGLTVFDYGAGIQNTLAGVPNESERQRVVRAFQKGVSSKPRSGTPYYGQGLTEVNLAANKLKAFVVVRSRGVLISYDARKEIRVPLEDQPESISWRKAAADRVPGVSLSVVFPNKLIQRIQHSLEV